MTDAPITRRTHRALETLVVAAVLAGACACTGGGAAQPDSSGSSPGPGTGTSSRSTSSPSPTAGTPSPATSTSRSSTSRSSTSRSNSSTSSSARPTPSFSGFVGPQAAVAAATTRLDQAAKAARDAGSSHADELRKKAYTAEALTAAQADAIVGTSAAGGADQRPKVNVLAISRKTASTGRLVVQSTAKGSALPRLSMLVADKPTQNWKVAAAATMLPGAAVAPFDPLPDGSRKLSVDKRGELAANPKELVQRYAAHLAYPLHSIGAPQITKDAYASRIRDGSSAAAQQLAQYAYFSRSFEPIPGTTHVIEHRSGGAMVFTVLLSTQRIDVKPGQRVAPPESFRRLDPSRSVITRYARVVSYEFLVFEVPHHSGRAKLVAASEHLVRAYGQ